MQNAGPIRWQHVTLVHQSGYAPIEPIITVPDLAPGEQAELTAKYPPIHYLLEPNIHSEWKLLYKGSPTSFSLQLSVFKGETTSQKIVYWFVLYSLYMYLYPTVRGGL